MARPIGSVIASGVGTAFSVTVQTLFWFTLVFALLERSAARMSLPQRTWSLDQLPEVPSPERLGIGEAVATVAANLFVAAGLLWVQLAPPIVVDGQAYPLFDPALWSFWLPWFLAVTLAEVGFAVLLYLRGRWTYGLAAINMILGAAFAIPAIYLLANDLAFNPAARRADPRHHRRDVDGRHGLDHDGRHRGDRDLGRLRRLPQGLAQPATRGGDDGPRRLSAGSTGRRMLAESLR